MTLDDAVKELEQHARHLGFSLRVIGKYAATGTWTLEIGAKARKTAEPRLVYPFRDWRHVG